MMSSSRLASCFLDAQQAAFVAGFHQLVDQRGGGGEASRHAFLAGCQTQAEGEMIVYR